MAREEPGASFSVPGCSVVVAVALGDVGLVAGELARFRVDDLARGGDSAATARISGTGALLPV